MLTAVTNRYLSPVLLLLLLGATPLYAQQSAVQLQGSVSVSDEPGPEGEGSDCHHGWAACNVWHHDQGTEGRYREAAMDCYPSLGRALDHEDDAYDLNQRLAKATEPERGALVDQFNQKLDERSTALTEHQDCIRDWFAKNKLPPPEEQAKEEPPRKTENSTAGTPDNRSWAVKLDEAIGKIPYLHEIDQFLEDISDYDMTKPHTGAKIMAESVASLLGEAGMSYLAKAAPKALASMGLAAKSAEAAAESGASAVTKTASTATEATGGAAATKTARGGGMTGTGPAKGGGVDMSDISPPPGAAADNVPVQTGGVDMSDVGAPPGAAADAPQMPWEPQPGGVDMSDVGMPPSAGVPESGAPLQKIAQPGQPYDTVGVWESQLPPGVELSPVTKETYRPISVQQERYSCGQACVKMVTETHIGDSLSESALRQMSSQLNAVDGYVPGSGTQMENLADMLNHVGIQNTGMVSSNVDDLARATELGHPAIIRMGRPGGGHFVVLDEVIESNFGRHFAYRDPANFQHLSPQGQRFMQESGFANAIVVDEATFVNDFLTDFADNVYSGKAIYTRPDFVPHPDTLIGP